MTIALVGGFHVPLLVLLIAQGHVHLCFHEFLENVLEAIPQEGVDIRHAA